MSTQFGTIESIKIDSERTTLEVWTTKNGMRFLNTIHLPYPDTQHIYVVGQPIEISVSVVTN